MMIRRMEGHDREAWIAMTKDFYRSPAVLRPVPEENFTRTFDMLTAGSPFVDGFVAGCKKQLLGSLLISLEWSNEAGGMVVWIEELYVRPESRGQGIGTALLRHAFAEYSGKARRFRLEAEPENTGAVHLYRKLGFRSFPYRQMIFTPCTKDPD